MLAGCSSTSIINRDGKETSQKVLSITKFNEDMKDKSLTVRLRNGLEYDATDVVVTRDSSSFQSVDRRITIPNDSVQHYRRRNHLGGAIEGFLFSVLPAVFFTQKFEFNDAEGRLIPVVPAYAGAGLITIGAGIAGKAEYYEFSADTLNFSNDNR